jgi:glutaredoxin
MSRAGQTKTFTVFSRQACALCDHLILALEILRPRYDFAYRKIDVDDDPELQARYGLRVPVLVDAETEICSGHCDPAEIETYIADQCR